MKLSNRLGLPEPIVEAARRQERLRHDTRGGARWTVSELIKPARIARLEELFDDVLEEDVSDRIYALLGAAIHVVLERSGAKRPGEGREHRLEMQLDDGNTVSGQMDRTLIYPDGAIEDWKLCSVWQVMNKEPRAEWEQQVNCYAMILRSNGIAVTRVRAVPIFRDWRKPEARRRREQGDSSYPPPAMVIDLPLWPWGQTRQFLRERIAAHLRARESLPLCTDEERWVKPERWAVKVQGHKRALPGGLHTSIEEAVAWLVQVAGKYLPRQLIVEERPRQPARCLDYCILGQQGICEQFKAEMREQPINRTLEELLQMSLKEGTPNG